ncbi:MULTISPECIES: Gfo/Idh/MocA family protein [unclassified Nocardioides]|uniref:Gfo/Idh/MocA family protein n=1 Tax=unclassified Nocardioides TaxID=2615069 RepID=UPI0036220D9B
MTDPRKPLRVAMIGHAFMGNAHSQAWRTAPHFFPLPLRPDMAVLVGHDAGRAAEAAERLGWAESSADWRDVVNRDDIDVIDICTPGDTHAEIAIAALEAGKHVLCEKPLANTVAEAEAMTAAADKARGDGVLAMVGFTYRRVPAIGLARQLIAEGRIGEIRHVRAQYLQDWISDPEAPLSWRLDKAKAGSGALGDIGAHIVDLTQYVTGDRIVELTGRLETFVKERPYAAVSTAGSLGGGGTSAERGPVTVDDAASFLASFSSGAMGVFEATRFANGRKNAIRIEVNGSAGSIAFDFEDMNVLEFFDASEPAETAGFRRILATEADHPYVAAWWPPGHGLGYEHGFTHQVVDLVQAIADGTDPSPTFADGLQVQRVLDAVETSSDTRSWQSLEGS